MAGEAAKSGSRSTDIFRSLRTNCPTPSARAFYARPHSLVVKFVQETKRKISRQAIDAFLANKTLAVVGVSHNTDKFGNYIYRAVRQAGYKVYAVTPNLNVAEGDHVMPGWTRYLKSQTVWCWWCNLRPLCRYWSTWRNLASAAHGLTKEPISLKVRKKPGSWASTWSVESA